MPGMERLWKNLRKSFFAGLLVVVPVAASIGILFWLFNTVTNWLLPAPLRGGEVEFLYRVAALLVFVVAVTVVGWVTRLMVGRRLVALAEKVLGRVPLLNRIYAFVKEVSHTLLAGQKTVFERVVLVEYPRPGVYAVGFVTSESEGEVQARTRESVINVFLPTTPNPTSGFLLMVPREQVIPLEMSVAEGMKLVISGGAVVPPYGAKSEAAGAKPQPAPTQAAG
jgi:uncharacterized membrane protein